MDGTKIDTAQVYLFAWFAYNVSRKYILLKRIFDGMFSFTVLAALVPLFIIISILIKLDSAGPVFFIQKRKGEKGLVFKMIKFRSMTADAEKAIHTLQEKNEAGKNLFKIKNDPRVTRIGRIIRKTSMDELPQLINVLKGEMSIVGPRPPIINETDGYDAWHNIRLSVKPGITGLWQVSGRSSMGFDEMVRLDLKYVRERNVGLDLLIIIKTIPSLFGDRNAF